MIKNIFNDSITAIVVMFSIITLGLFIPMLVSIFIAVFTKATLAECIMSVPFWLFTIIGWVIAGIYANDSVKKDPNG